MPVIPFQSAARIAQDAQAAADLREAQDAEEARRYREGADARLKELRATGVKKFDAQGGTPMINVPEPIPAGGARLNAPGIETPNAFSQPGVIDQSNYQPEPGDALWNQFEQDRTKRASPDEQVMWQGGNSANGQGGPDNPVTLNDAQAAELEDWYRKRKDAEASADIRSRLMSDINPDEAAKAIEIAPKLGASRLEVQNNLQTFTRADMARELDRMRSEAPKVDAWLRSSPENFDVAHDDVESLGWWESAASMAYNTPGTLWAAAVGFTEKTFGIAQMGVDGADELGRSPSPAMAAIFGNPREADRIARDLNARGTGGTLPQDPNSPLAIASNAINAPRKSLREYKNAVMPQGRNDIESGYYSGIVSLAEQAPLIIASAVTKNPAFMTVGMTATTAGEAYSRATDEHPELSYGQRAGYALSQAGIEFLTEVGPNALFVEALLKGSIKEQVVGFGKQQLVEQFGEQTATAFQDMNDWLTLNPKATWEDYLKERPSAALQTFVATLVAGGGQVALGKASDAVGQRLDAANQQKRSEDLANYIRAIGDNAKDSKLLKRLPDKYREAVAAVTKDGPRENVRISPEGIAELAQSQGVTPEQLAQAFRIDPETMVQAMDSGDDIVVPSGNFAAVIQTAKKDIGVSGETIYQALAPHIRLNENDFTARESEAFQKVAKAEADARAEWNTTENDFAASSETVETDIRDQIRATGRFNEDTVDGQAKLMGQLVNVIAKQTGQDPVEVWKNDGFNIISAVTGEQTDGAVLPQGVELPADATPTQRLIDMRAKGSSNAEIATALYPDVEAKTAVNRVKALASKHKGKIEERKAALEDSPSLNQTDSKLPMDEGSRLARAREQGFDVDTPLYVSTLEDLEQFDKHGKFMGHKGISGVSLTDNPKMAERYLERFGERNYKGEPFKKNMMKVYIRPGKVIELDKPLQSKIGMGFPLPEGYKWPKELDGYDTVIFTDRVSSKGAVAHSPPDDELGILRELTDDPTYQGDALVGREFIVRDPSQIRVAHAKFDPAESSSSKLLAHGGNAPNATIALGRTRALIKMFEGANLSSLAHEGAHWYLDLLFRMSKSENPHPFVQAQMARILEFAGKSQEWDGMFDAKGDFTEEGRKLQEQFAEAFEVYLMTGKAPSVGMRSVFNTFKQWILGVYKAFKKGVAQAVRDVGPYTQARIAAKERELGRRLNDQELVEFVVPQELRDVFDRMLATEDAINAAQTNMVRDSEAMAKAMLEKLDPEGKWKPERQQKFMDRMRERYAEAKERAEAALMARLMDEHTRAKSAVAREEERDIRREVQSEVDEQPAQRVFQVLSGQGWRDTRADHAEAQADAAEVMATLAQMVSTEQRQAWQLERGAVDDTPYYFGTYSAGVLGDIENYDLSKAGSQSGSGERAMFLTTSSKRANTYADPGMSSADAYFTKEEDPARWEKVRAFLGGASVSDAAVRGYISRSVDTPGVFKAYVRGPVRDVDWAEYTGNVTFDDEAMKRLIDEEMARPDGPRNLRITNIADGGNDRAAVNMVVLDPDNVMNAISSSRAEDAGSSLAQGGRQVGPIGKVSSLTSAMKLASSRTFPTNRHFKVALQERVLAAAEGGIDLSEAFGKMSPEVEDYLVNMVLTDAAEAMKTNGNAVGWYDEKVTKATRLLALLHPEIETDPKAKFAFVWALAVTSNGMKVNENFALAERVYQAFKKTGKMPTNLGTGTAAKAINNSLALYDKLIETHGFEALERFMTTKTTVKVAQAFAGTPISGENLTTEVFGAAVLGPKIGNGFFMNLYGEFGQLTIDRWLMRTWGRWSGSLIENNPVQVKAKRQQLKALIQELSAEEKRAFEDIVGRKLTVGDLDAVAQAITKASQKPEKRREMALVGPAKTKARQSLRDQILGAASAGQLRGSFGDEMRKAGNALTKYLDGQNEQPGGPPERGNIRKVFGRALEELRMDNPSLTMADLQALLWYPEKLLYDAAKSADRAVTSYEDDEAPDYANAAEALVRNGGVSERDIRATLARVDRGLQAARRAAAARSGDRGRGAGGSRSLAQGGTLAQSQTHDPKGERELDALGFYSAVFEAAKSVRPDVWSMGWDHARNSIVKGGAKINGQRVAPRETEMAYLGLDEMFYGTKLKGAELAEAVLDHIQAKRLLLVENFARFDPANAVEGQKWMVRVTKDLETGHRNLAGTIWHYDSEEKAREQVKKLERIGALGVVQKKPGPKAKLEPADVGIVRDAGNIRLPGEDVPLFESVIGLPEGVPGSDYQAPRSHVGGKAKGTLVTAHGEERIDDKGQRTLFTGQVQSDMAQQAREDKADASHHLAVIKLLEENPDTEWFGIDAKGEYRPPLENENRRNLIARGTLERGVEDFARVADVPLLSTSEWTNVGVRAMVYRAARDGFASVSFPTSETSEIIQGNDTAAGHYDTNVKGALEKIGKQLGGEVRLGAVAYAGEGESEYKVAYDKFNRRYYLVNEEGREKLETFKTKQAAEDALENLTAEQDATAYVLDITPAMRAKIVSEGFPLFQTRTGKDRIAQPASIPAMRLNLDAVREQYGPEAVAALPPEVRAYSTEATDADDFVTQAKAVRQTLNKKHPKSLWKFLSSPRRIGEGNDKISYRGIRDDGGEILKIIGAKKEGVGLISDAEDSKRARSYTIEHAAEVAWAEGYFSTESPPTPQEFLDALRADFDGQAKLYARNDMALVDEIKNAEQWAAWFDENGIDITEKDHAVLKAQIETKLSGQTENAIGPDEAAPFFGMPDGKALLEALKQGPMRDKLIRDETKRRMAELHGDTFSDGRIMEEAMAYARNEIQHRQFEIELEALAEAAGQRAQANLAKQTAIDNLRSKQVREVLNYNQWLTLSERWGKKAVEAAAKGDMAKAMEFARYRLINSHMYTEGKRLAEKIEKTRTHLLDYGKKTKQARLFAAGAEYQANMNGLLSDYQFRNESKKGESQRAARGAWIKAQMAGIDPWAPYQDNTKSDAEKQAEAAEQLEKSQLLASLGEGADAKGYKSLTVEEMLAVRDEADLIWKLATLKDRLLKEGERRRLSLAAGDVAAEIEANQPNEKPPEPIETDAPGYKLKRGGLKYLAMHRTLQSLARQFAGGKDGGKFWNYIVRPLNEAFARLSTIRHQMGKDVGDLFSAYTEDEKRRMFRDRQTFDFTQSGGPRITLSKQGRLAFALNWGNDKNRRRLMDSLGLDASMVGQVLDTLDKRDWDFVQKTWDYLDTWFPEANRVHEAVHGAPMDKEDPLKVATRFGIYSGGYYPIKFDPMLSSKTGQRQVMADSKAMTGQVGQRTAPSFSKARAKGKVTLPLRLSVLDVITRHLDQVATSIATEEAFFDAGRIIKQAEVENAIVTRHGREVYNTIVNMLVTAKFGLEGASGVLAHLRNGATVVGLGWKVGTALLQPLGISNSIVRVGGFWIAKGYAMMGSDAVTVRRRATWATERSEFMRNRREANSPEMAALRKDLKASVIDLPIRIPGLRLTKKGMDAIKDNAFAMMANVQFYSVDVPTWYGALLKAQAAGMNEADAIAEADQAVIDAQGGGELHQTAAMQTGAGTRYAAALRLLTNFMSYMVTTYNLATQRARSARTPAQLAALAFDMAILFAIPVAGKMMLDAWTKGGGDGEDDDDPLWEAYMREQIAFLLSPFVGISQVAGTVRGDDAYGYRGPAGLGVFAEATNAGKALAEADFDASFWRPANKVAGMVFHYPASQIDASIRGAAAYFNGETDNPASFLVGPPPSN